MTDPNKKKKHKCGLDLYYADNREDMATEQVIANLAMKEGLEIFLDQFGEAYCSLPKNPGSCIKLHSDKFNTWLSHAMFKHGGRGLRKDMRQMVVQMLTGWATYTEKPKSIDVRIVRQDEDVWYQLGDGKTVKINRTGWEIPDRVPTLFREMSHQKNQVEPALNGNVKILLDFVNMPRVKEGLTGERLLLLVWLVAAFIPDIPHPIIVLHGPQGSAKTTTFKLLRRLIDPSSLEILSFPENHTELVQVASHHYFLPFDNLSSISTSNSDTLCRICTGEGFTKRKLYTDDDDMVYSYRRIIGLNGINVAPEKADLLDRSLLIGLERITRVETEDSFWRRFSAVQPSILGGIFDVLVKALGILDTIPEQSEFRMADFARYGCAIAQALGLTNDDFLNAYRNSIQGQNTEAISASLIGSGLRDFMESRNHWVGSPTELLGELTSQAASSGIDTKRREWPKDPRWVKRRAIEIKTNLAVEGIHIEWNQPTAKKVTIWKDVENVEDGGNDDIPTFPTEPTLPAL